MENNGENDQLCAWADGVEPTKTTAMALVKKQRLFFGNKKFAFSTRNCAWPISFSSNCFISSFVGVPMYHYCSFFILSTQNINNFGSFFFLSSF